jgi:hypothetical protein
VGYAVYEVGHRWCGYGVPATCDHPGCGASIDRGLAYVCGDEAGGGEMGCGLYFCYSHLLMSDRPQLCQRCYDGGSPFEPTPDTPEWVAHMLTDSSWAQWRSENPDAVAAMSTAATR